MKIAGARILLHVVGHDNDRAGGLQPKQKLLDLCGRHRIKRRAWLVEQKNFRVNRQGAGDTEPLLLAAGKSVRGFVKLIFHFIPRAARRKLRSTDSESFPLYPLIRKP